MTTCTITETEASVSIQPILSEPKEYASEYGKYKFFIWDFETRVKWLNVFFVTLWHIIAVWALFKYPFWNHWGLLLYGKYDRQFYDLF